MLLRTLLAVIALPGVVAVVVPLLLAGRALRGPYAFAGLAPLIAGLALLLWCVRDFYVVGKGTLAPWDPPRRLVTTGLYRFSRNPMYVAVGLILLGWALLFRSWGLLLYALGVTTAFHVRVVWGEEPVLQRAYEREWQRYRAQVPRWIFRSRKSLLLSAAAGVVAILIAGLVYEAAADARGTRDFPPPGRLVDIGGRRLHLLCIGEGSPTVIFEASGWGNSTSSPLARERIATRTTVCSYDRRGMGWSDAAPGATTVADLAGDLGVLQDRAKLQWPFVLVASSIGGLTAEMFTRQFPERVAGLVMVDAATSTLVPRLESDATLLSVAACGAGALAQFGVIRLLDPFALGTDSDEARRGAALTYSGKAWAEMCAMARGLGASHRQLEQAPPLPGNLPLVVLSAASTTDLVPPGVKGFVNEDAIAREMQQAHKEMAGRSSRGTWRIVPDSTHLIGASQPDAVADAVLELIGQLERR
jgi:protein-S-isoprenylcysteine O-methyltransferase Ste14/pimeloyl-ACP methyl ester carboxylesterase